MTLTEPKPNGPYQDIYDRIEDIQNTVIRIEERLDESDCLFEIRDVLYEILKALRPGSDLEDMGLVPNPIRSVDFPKETE